MIILSLSRRGISISDFFSFKFKLLFLAISTEGAIISRYNVMIITKKLTPFKRGLLNLGLEKPLKSKIEITLHDYNTNTKPFSSPQHVVCTRITRSSKQNFPFEEKDQNTNSIISSRLFKNPDETTNII